MISSVDICIQYSGQFALEICCLLEQKLRGGPDTLDVPPELGQLLLAQPKGADSPRVRMAFLQNTMMQKFHDKCLDTSYQNKGESGHSFNLLNSMSRFDLRNCCCQLKAPN